MIIWRRRTVTAAQRQQFQLRNTDQKVFSQLGLTATAEPVILLAGRLLDLPVRQNVENISTCIDALISVIIRFSIAGRDVELDL